MALEVVQAPCLQYRKKMSLRVLNVKKYSFIQEAKKNSH